MTIDVVSRPVPGTHLFVYGSLVEPHCMQEVLGHWHMGERLRARLAGYARRTSEAFAYPFLLASPGSTVDGVLVMDLTSADMEALDAYEEVDTGVYQRVSVEVEVSGCGPRTWCVPAQTYVAGPWISNQLLERTATPLAGSAGRPSTPA